MPLVFLLTKGIRKDILEASMWGKMPVEVSQLHAANGTILFIEADPIRVSTLKKVINCLISFQV